MTGPLEIWVDAQIAPGIDSWLTGKHGVSARALRDLGLRHAKDRDIFLAARRADVTVMTKDLDFLRLLEELGPPPRVVWLTLGNTSNQRLREVLTKHWHRIQQALAGGEILVEITDE